MIKIAEPNKGKLKELFVTRRQMLFGILVDAYNNLELWRELFISAKEQRNRYFFNRYDLIFNMSINALEQTGLNYTFKIIDKQKDSLSLFKFLDFIEQNTSI